MFEFQWNALRVGDRVVVHDDLDPQLAAHDATVALVRTRNHAVNEVAVRLDDRTAKILRPRRHAVHLVPVDRRFDCWRCLVSSAERVAGRSDSA